MIAGAVTFHGARSEVGKIIFFLRLSCLSDRHDALVTFLLKLFTKLASLI